VLGNRYPYRDSGNVYENKGSNDKMTENVSGICAWLRVILQKNTDFERHFSLNCHSLFAIYDRERP